MEFRLDTVSQWSSSSRKPDEFELLVVFRRGRSIFLIESKLQVTIFNRITEFSSNYNCNVECNAM